MALKTKEYKILNINKVRGTNMEFYHLRSFVIVAKTGNLTLAAKQLCTTAPAVSAHIKSLESELKTVLFERSSRGMSITVKGKVLLEKAHTILDSALDMVNCATENQNELMGNFKFAINQNPRHLKISDLLSNITEIFPGISTQLVNLSSDKTIKAIKEGTIDGGFIYGDVPQYFAYIEVKKQKITTISPIEFDINEDNLMTGIEAYPWITMGEQCPFDKLLKQKLGNKLNSQSQVDDDNSRLELVKAGLGLSFFEFEEAISYANKNQLKILTQLDFETPLYFIVAKNKLDDPIVKAMLQEIRVIWGIKL